jgi:hypothetical protein
MTIAAGDAHEFPIYAGRYRVYFPLLDADGDLVTGASTPDSERSIDGATFADCTNEMTEVATGSGVYYLDLTKTEMTSKCTVVIAKSATAGMKTTVLTLYPKRMFVLRSGTAQAGGSATITLDSGASAKDNAYAGMYVQCSNNTPSNVEGQTRKIISYVGSTKVATVEANWGTNPSSSTTFDLLCPESVNNVGWLGKPTADTHSDGYPVCTQKVGTGTGEINLSSGSVPATLGTGVITSASFASGALTSTAVASGFLTSSAFATDSITSGALATSAVTEIATALNAEVVDCLNVDTYTEPAQGTPGVNVTLQYKIGFLYKLARNKITQTSSEFAVYADDTTTKDHEAVVSDDGTTFSRGELSTGA